MSSATLRILHITLASEHGGLSQYIYDISSAMRRQGHQVFVAGDRGTGHALFESAPFPYIEIPLKSGPIAFVKSMMTLRRFLRDHPVDVIHTHYRRATALGRRMQSRTSGGKRPPVLYTLHLSHIGVSGLRGWLTDFGDHVHAASEDARQWLVRDAHVPEPKITLIPHGIDVSRFPVADEHAKRSAKRALGLDPDARVAAFVGRFENPKNEAWLLDLAGATRAELPNLHLLLVGGGVNEPTLRDRIDAENLHDRVHLFGYRDPVQVYQATDLLLLPSAREGFSLVCAEAMCSGVPVLRTRTSGTAELIIEGVTGRSVPIDHDAFLDAAVVMLRDRDALSCMGLAAAKHLRDNFTFEKQVEQTIELYRRLSGT